MNRCAHNGKWFPCPERVPARPTAAWSELHPVALRGELTAEFLADFHARVASIGCDCRRHWEEIVARKQPPLGGTAAAQFAWSVEVHNEVNVRLEYPIVSVRRARRIWTDVPPPVRRLPAQAVQAA